MGQRDQGEGGGPSETSSVGPLVPPEPGPRLRSTDDDSTEIVGAAVGRRGREPTASRAPEGAEDRSASDPVVPAGGTVGRYVVLDTLGQGGMGVVVAAFDPTLERKVAIKLVRPVSADPREAERRRTYLRREAQALAALNHPNVVAIYDVGQYAIPGSPNGLYIAMELEQGETLQKWARRPHPWREVVDVFLQAGQGLEAAHEAGLVHGDFKPANVLRRSDGRIVVLDFGLARYRRPLSDRSRAELHGEVSTGPLLEETLGEPGFVMGTPAYMAPEQYEGEQGKAADQFAFCVALYRTLYGRHPFAPEDEDNPTRESIVHRIRQGVRVPTPRQSSGPAALGRVLARGLAHDPHQRWPDMGALLSRLRSVRRGRTRAAAGAGIMLAVAATTWAIAGVDDPGAELRRCGDNPELDAAWNHERRQRLRDTVRSLAAREDGTPLAWLGDTARVTERDLDRYVRQWRREHRRQCEAPVPVDARQAANRRLRRACLDGGLIELSTLVDLLLEADVDTWASLGRPAADLSRPAACDQIEIGENGVTDALPEGGRGVRRTIAAGRAYLHAGKHDEALAAADAALAQARAGGSLELEAYAHWLVGNTLDAAGEYDEAVRSLGHAAWACSLLECDAVAVHAMSDLIKILASDRVDLEAAARWEDRARVALGRLRVDDPLLESVLYNSVGLLRLARADYEASVDSFRHSARLLDGMVGNEGRLASTYNNLGNALEAQGRAAEAAVVLRAAVQMRKASVGAEHPSVASALSNLGIAELAADETAAARAHFLRAIEITEASIGTEHPSLALYNNNLANVYYNWGDFPAARRYYQRTLEVLDAAFGPDHPNIALTLGNLGLVTDDAEDALGLHRRALAMLERTTPEGHPYRGMALNNIGSALRRLERYDEATAAYQRALAIRERALGPEHPLVATTVDNLGSTARLTGRPEEAIPRHERALSIWLAAYGEEHRKIPVARTGLAQALLAAFPDDPAQVRRARGLAEAALKACEAEDTDPIDRADAQLALARAWSVGPDEDLERARTLAKEARAIFTEVEGRGAKQALALAAEILDAP